MMLKMVIAPLLGGIIGYITNDLAIKMLFRPRKSIYIGKFHVPFTPGLIPQQKPRIAKSIGKVISEQLLNTETLREVVLSEKTTIKLRTKIHDFIESLKYEKRTIRELLELRFSSVQINTRIENVEKKAAEVISEKLVQANIGNIVVENGFDIITENEMVNRFASFFIDSSMQDLIKRNISDKINRMVEEKAPSIIYGEIEKNKEILLETPMNEIYIKYKDKEDTIIDFIMGTYTTLLEENLEHLLNAINVEKIVVNKVNSFDAVQLEMMIFGIMKRELKAIVYLGAVLGFFMGFINLLF